ncbi:hypothetical protein [Gimesia algae]|uniref:Carboxypeptidase regulatory-like domain-containing protein n=1 Tax=Gimesia algae TaxID=2527971 RepID=A0A517VHU6_9PLAN|nr:hypothetical protein [Gimesia algae]QDT92584.1 hypothetical protein Pan161_42520 [Gimesia algae]
MKNTIPKAACSNLKFTLVISGCALLCVLELSGCSRTPGAEKPRGAVTIQITNGTDPVTEGQVDLVNEQTGEGGGGTLNSDGTASLEMVALGTYTVTVNPPPQEPVVPGQAPPAVKNYENIPTQVRKINTSPLKLKVKSGSNEFAFDLKQTD